MGCQCSCPAGPARKHVSLRDSDSQGPATASQASVQSAGAAAVRLLPADAAQGLCSCLITQQQLLLKQCSPSTPEPKALSIIAEGSCSCAQKTSCLHSRQRLHEHTPLLRSQPRPSRWPGPACCWQTQGLVAGCTSGWMPSCCSYRWWSQAATSVSCTPGPCVLNDGQDRLPPARHHGVTHLHAIASPDKAIKRLQEVNRSRKSRRASGGLACPQSMALNMQLLPVMICLS